MALRLNYEDVVRGENMTIKFPSEFFLLSFIQILPPSRDNFR